MRTPGYLRRPIALATSIALLLPAVSAANYTTAASPNLDLSHLGRVALAGDFDSISLYTYDGQNEAAGSANGSQYLLTRYPDGSFETLALSDAYVTTMCPFVKDGTFVGVVVGGNFTSLGGVQAQGIALWNPNTTEVTALDGLSGHVTAVYCDDASSTVYVGGSFSGGNSTNAIAWSSGWANLPFAGFNGPVTSITKSSNNTIVFGGSFDGLGNTTTPKTKDEQVVSLAAANITSDASTRTPGFSDPANIVCQTGEDSAGNTWLLADNTPGYWLAEFPFGFNPTKLRIYNTNYEGRGTKTFRYTAFPINGIMNLTYTDANGNNQSCTARCPLPEGNTTYQDFRFVNDVGMNGFRVDISDWYGSGGGLSGIELFQDDIYAFAISDFNEPVCDSVSTGANSTATGPWRHTPSGASTSDYLTANLTGTVTIDSASVVFKPDIKQSGNYSITVYTPGCVSDGTCDTRGIVNVTGSMTEERGAISTTLYQTNYNDKYDQVYYGYVDAGSDTFRPMVTLAPASGQKGPLTVVAQRVRFELVNSTGGLNGLYEYNPDVTTMSTDFSSSTIDSAANSLDSDAVINALAVYEDTIYVAGNFSSANIRNIFSIGSGGPTPLPGGGLNAEVLTIYQNGTTLYVGGNFTNTEDNSKDGLAGVAVYSIDDKSWTTFGAGVNGPVWAIVPLHLNVTGTDLEDVLALSGDFTEVNSVGSNATYSANGFAVWVPSQSNWLHNIANATISLQGRLLTQTDVPYFDPLLAGYAFTEKLGMSGAVALTGSGSPSLVPLGVSIASPEESSSSTRKRAITTAQNVTGVATGYFYLEGGKNMTILGGHFTANSSSGTTINNFLVLDNTNSQQQVVGLPGTIDSDSVVLALDVQGSDLFVGGSITGDVNGHSVDGLIAWDLSTSALSSSQPAALSGNSVSVNTIASQPSSSNVYVGGSFDNAGSMSCPSLCTYDTSTGQWMPPASGLNGTINVMIWRADTELIVGGDFTTEGNSTRLALYDSKKQTFTDFGTSSTLPGPVTALTPADAAYERWWVAGTSTNGTAFLQKFDGNSWNSVSGLGPSTTIRGLQIMSLTSNHDISALVGSDEVLLITGSIDVPGSGNASAVLYNGTTFEPFILTTMSDGSQGSLSGMFVQNPSNFLTSKSHHLALGLVVLIGLAIACALTFLLVVAGILVERYRRRKQGYVQMPALRPDQHANLDRIPPESLFGTLEKRSDAPRV